MNKNQLTKHQSYLKSYLKHIFVVDKSNNMSDAQLIHTYYNDAIACGRRQAQTDRRLIEFDEAVDLAIDIIKRKGLANFNYPTLKEELIERVNRSVCGGSNNWGKLPTLVKKSLCAIALREAQETDGTYIIAFANDVCAIMVGTRNFKFTDCLKNEYTEEELDKHNLSKMDIDKINLCYKNVRESTTFVDVIKNLGKAARIEYSKAKNWYFVGGSLSQNQIDSKNPINDVDYIDVLTFFDWVERAKQGKKISIKTLARVD